MEKEAKRKIAAGYPTDNIIFQAPERAILYQNGVRQGLNEDISSPTNLVELLRYFFEFREPHHREWEDAVAEFNLGITSLSLYEGWRIMRVWEMRSKQITEGVDAGA